MLQAASQLIALKGKKISEFDLAKGVTDEAVQAMLGPTGNLRAPTLKLGKRLIVGFNEAVYQQQFG